MLAHAIVSGRVQGVGFRYATQHHAEKHHLTGWVRNRTDGTVELEIEGSDEQVNQFLDKLRNGLNPYIRVDNVELTTQQQKKGFDAFNIV